jgi:LSD1 subclass zinc finger protein
MAVKRGQIMMTLGIILILVGVVLYLFVFDFATSGKAVWTLDKLEKDCRVKDRIEIDNNGSDVIVFDSYTFRSLQPDDTVFIKDTVLKMEYNSTVGKTVVWFESSGHGRIKNWTRLQEDVLFAFKSTSDGHAAYLFFDGDVTSDLEQGEEIGIELTISGTKDLKEFITQLGDPEGDEALGLSTDDIIDIGSFEQYGMILVIAGAAMIGVGAFFNFKLDREAKPAAAGDGAEAAPKREVATGAPTRQTKCPACGNAIAIAAGATSITCSSCGRSYQIGAGATGAAAQRPSAAAPQKASQTKCPGCGTMISVPAGAASIRCHGCGRSYNVGGGAQRAPAAAPRPPAGAAAGVQRPPAGAPAGAARPPAGAPAGGARSTRCPGCGGNIVIPPGVKSVTCPSCRQSFRVG